MTSPNAERLVKMLDSISKAPDVVEVKPRKREFVLMAIAAFLSLYLLMARLEANDVSHKVIEENREQERPAMSYPLNWTASTTMLGKTRLYVPHQRERNF
jgi:hypothetical protein